MVQVGTIGYSFVIFKRSFRFRSLFRLISSYIRRSHPLIDYFLVIIVRLITYPVFIMRKASLIGKTSFSSKYLHQSIQPHGIAWTRLIRCVMWFQIAVSWLIRLSVLRVIRTSFVFIITSHCYTRPLRTYLYRIWQRLILIKTSGCLTYPTIEVLIMIIVIIDILIFRMISALKLLLIKLTTVIISFDNIR